MMPEASGQLYTYSNSRDTLELALSFGPSVYHDHVAPDDCWALRRGRAYAFGRNQIEFRCGHVDGSEAPYFCLPIVAHGETIGMLHIDFPALGPVEKTGNSGRAFLDQRWEVALTCAEQISLAIANVRLRMELQDQSIKDQLTGLWNRRWFLDSANRDLQRNATTGSDFGLISLDVDHFKKFNDHHGHDAGDAVLREVGRLIIETFGDPMSPCRIGGEEFIVMCPGMDEAACSNAARAFRKAVQALELRHSGNHLPAITVSQGIAMAASASDGVLGLMKAADQALYAAKAAGRDCVILESEMSKETKKATPKAIAAE